MLACQLCHRHPGSGGPALDCQRSWLGQPWASCSRLPTTPYPVPTSRHATPAPAPRTHLRPPGPEIGRRPAERVADGGAVVALRSQRADQAPVPPCVMLSGLQRRLVGFRVLQDLLAPLKRHLADSRARGCPRCAGQPPAASRSSAQPERTSRDRPARSVRHVRSRPWQPRPGGACERNARTSRRAAGRPCRRPRTSTPPAPSPGAPSGQGSRGRGTQPSAQRPRPGHQAHSAPEGFELPEAVPPGDARRVSAGRELAAQPEHGRRGSSSVPRNPSPKAALRTDSLTR
jgi:hypothetical protein